MVMVCICLIALSCAGTPIAAEGIQVEPLALPPAGYKDSIKGLPARIDIQTLFADEPVTIYVGRQRVFSKKVTTNQTTGLADSVIVNWTQPKIQLRILIGDERKEWRCDVDLEQGIYLGILRANGRIQVLQSASPFGYM
jgi:hypothetical protein